MAYKEKLAELKRVDRDTYDLFLEDLMGITYGDGNDCPDVDDPIGHALLFDQLVIAIQERRKWGWSVHGCDPAKGINAAQVTVGYHEQWVDGKKREMPDLREGDGHTPASALLDAYLATLRAGFVNEAEDANVIQIPSWLWAKKEPCKPMGAFR